MGICRPLVQTAKADPQAYAHLARCPVAIIFENQFARLRSTIARCKDLFSNQSAQGGELLGYLGRYDTEDHREYQEKNSQVIDV